MKVVVAPDSFKGSLSAPAAMAAGVRRAWPQAEVVLSTVRIGYLQLPFLKLSDTDVLLIYCMVLVGVLVSSHGVVEKLVPGLSSLNCSRSRQMLSIQSDHSLRVENQVVWEGG